MQIVFIDLNRLPPTETFLTAAESEYLQTLRASKRRNDWLGGRFALKAALTLTDGFTPCKEGGPSVLFLEPSQLTPAQTAALKTVETSRLPGGAPEAFVGGVRVSRAISVTHSNGWAAAAAGPENCLLGLDLEKVETRSAAWAEMCFSAAERAGADAAGLTRLWTAKEAVVKLLGRGLDLNTQEVQILPGQVRLTGRAESFWASLNRPEIRLITPTELPGFACTLAIASCEQGPKFAKI